ncbi:hypothetical protein [Streptomyces stelliscabiei]|uniref:Uncharacterized protein n=1 Tax=Streptomyces stelliscabiei TaxID=146820 RepID=A0A8I0P6Z4_9ACTN|nr:hypothetical protein [Streptomyces stelliscabiei]KND44026.1 hypothetical protein IQ64_14990 [Streptomyces stelliscabiei]MBE1598662.1 hypothetical protein [Streptomyces stelliscabiei]MDX2516546.1 hypothetical protein [Streptomyces stelliscabiei]MDX2553572.1 hypothetical protein [Streptomyces stelliscabiei]MDX2613452.1 hypothetical protein [Streptomyces stelliscabiei]
MPGTVLLLAASPMGRGCLVDAASVLPVLAAVTPEVLSGTGTANVVELADPLEPQAVLTRLRAAATAPGPLTVYLTGQLQLDRRQRLVHLALARTTPATVRYTAFPWHWIVEELRLRAPGSTTLFVDLHADAEVWRQLAGQPLSAGPGVSLYGRIAPPAGGVRRGVAAPGYMKALATILRSGQRPAPGALHEQVLARTGGYGDLVLARDATAPDEPVPHGEAARAVPPVPAPLPAPVAAPAVTDPHSAIAVAVEAGRHSEAAGLAARWEQGALREFGDGSEEVLHWREVRADLAMFAGDAAGSCEAWMGVAGARLAAGRLARDPVVEAAVDRAHHQWGLVTDAGRALELGAVFVELRGRVPGRRAGALEHARQRLAELRRQEGELRSAQHVPG